MMRRSLSDFTRYRTLFILLFLSLTYVAQAQKHVSIDTSKKSVEYWNKWLKNLNDKGVAKTPDSFFVKEEVIRLLKDSVYRKSLYPEKYNWPDALKLLQQMELKKAFWHMINLYEIDTAHRNIVLGTFI